MPKIPPIFVKGKIKLLWSVAVRGAPLALGLLALLVLMVCLLWWSSPLKGKAGARNDQVSSVTLVTSFYGYRRASAGPSLLANGALFLKFYRNIL